MEYIGPATSGGIGINKEPNDYHATWNGTEMLLYTKLVVINI